jgi:hypothetical protein
MVPDLLIVFVLFYVSKKIHGAILDFPKVTAYEINMVENAL